MDPSVLAELPPEVLAMIAAENGGSIPNYPPASPQQHYQDDINEAII